jgi:dolichol-phosphate mannosyltransferase
VSSVTILSTFESRIWDSTCSNHWNNCSIHSYIKVNKGMLVLFSHCKLQPNQEERLIPDKRIVDVSIIVPTYNESHNIISLLESIERNVPISLLSEIVVVDDNSPDKTGEMAEAYFEETDKKNTNQITTMRQPNLTNLRLDDSSALDSSNCDFKVIHRPEKKGLVSAILEGVRSSKGQIILVMDADFSHSPSLIPRMVNELMNTDVDIVVASRYVEGGRIRGWPLKRRLISKGAVKIAQYGLPIKKEVKDPMSGFFALKRRVLDDITIDSAGYKILLEILVKANNARVKEIPYTFTNRTFGKSKLDNTVVWDYIKALYHLYRYGQKSGNSVSWLSRVKKRKAVLFLSKAGRFYTVGASGLLLNYFVSVILYNSSLTNLGYIQATIGGIIVSNISNFLLNKAWTFEDRDFSPRKTLRQYGLFAAITSGGAGIQLGVLHVLLQSGYSYEMSLIIAVSMASISNFLLNKKLTFGERVWG